MFNTNSDINEYDRFSCLIIKNKKMGKRSTRQKKNNFAD